MSSDARGFERIRIAVSEAASRQWREPWPVARSSSKGLELPLQASPMVRRCLRILLLALLLHIAVLVWTRHPWAAMETAALAAGLAWQRKQAARSGEARRLLVAADGRLHLLRVSGQVEAVKLHPASMRLGDWVLLRVSAPGIRRTFLLGPDNVDPGVLAALRRRLG